MKFLGAAHKKYAIYEFFPLNIWYSFHSGLNIFSFSGTLTSLPVGSSHSHEQLQYTFHYHLNFFLGWSTPKSYGLIVPPDAFYFTFLNFYWTRFLSLPRWRSPVVPFVAYSPPLLILESLASLPSQNLITSC